MTKLKYKLVGLEGKREHIHDPKKVYLRDVVKELNKELNEVMKEIDERKWKIAKSAGWDYKYFVISHNEDIEKIKTEVIKKHFEGK